MYTSAEGCAASRCTVGGAALPRDLVGAQGRNAERLANVSSVVSAPVAPDGTVAGALTDVVLTFANRNPLVDGLPLKAGATVEVALPDAFLADRDGVNIGIILQGWPQSPPGPPPLFPWTTAVDGNTVTLTLTSDYLPGAKGPGPKQVHLLLGGFSNPQAAGMYPIELAITPDPASGETLRGIGTVEILAKTAPSIQPLSTVNGAPPPPFPNSLYQTLVPGEMPLSWGFYIWGRDGVPQVGADLVKQHDTLYWIVNGKGYRVGWVKVRPPRGAKTFELTTTGPAASADTVVTALPAALLKAQFTPDAYATGRYQVIWHMSGGTTQWMHLNVTSKTKMTVVSAVESAVVTGLDTPAHEDDVLVFQTTIHAGEGGPEIGRSGGRCDGTGAFPGVSPSHVCFTVTALAGGDIWHASWIPNPGEPVQAGAIIGGTGRYAHASGTVTFKDISKAGDFSLAENTYDVRHGAHRSEQDAVKFTVVGVVESFEFTGPETPRDEDDVLIFETPSTTVRVGLRSAEPRVAAMPPAHSKAEDPQTTASASPRSPRETSGTRAGYRRPATPRLRFHPRRSSVAPASTPMPAAP